MNIFFGSQQFEQKAIWFLWTMGNGLHCKYQEGPFELWYGFIRRWTYGLWQYDYVGSGMGFKVEMHFETL